MDSEIIDEIDNRGTGVQILNPEREGSFSDLRGAVALAHHFLRGAVKTGDRVVDATCGNGHDTLFLAGLVGESGKLWAFDAQGIAISNTATLLEQKGFASRVKLIAAGHENLAEHVDTPVKAVVLNLGFLPGGDRGFMTRSDTTVAALEQSVGLLLPGGVVTVALYPGHSGGDDESVAVERWGSELDPGSFNVWRHRQLNRSEAAPYLLLVEKRRNG